MNTQEKEYVTIKPMTSQFDPNNKGGIDVSRRSSVLDLMDQYHDIARNIHRIPGMGQLSHSYSEVIEQIRKVLVHLRIYLNNPNVKSKTGTIVDGTDYQQMKPGYMGTGIEYINHIWIANKAHACMVLTQMEWFTTPSLYWKRLESTRTLVVIPLEDLTHDAISAYFTHDMVTGKTEVDFSLIHAAIYSLVYEIYAADEEYPVAAAIYVNGTIFEMQRPYRHHHILQTKEYSTFTKSQEEGKVVIQGFVTNFGNFVTRRRGLLMAADKDMIVTDTKLQMTTTEADQFFRHDVEAHMQGRLHPIDHSFKSYAVADTGLFSEDLW